MFRVTRSYRFPASHRLHSPQLSDDENRAIYGKCNHPFGHGHNYTLEVTACGPADESGRAVDPQSLDDLVERQVLTPFSHRHLNTDVNFFADRVPTSENLAVEICRRLKENWKAAFPGAWPKLDRVRIAETARNIFEIHAHEID
ncbi:MAG TPA: 6-carboxytetrahydropterin synthase [Bryobacteraceae bacterium]|nr:6-carboxytetrahydropterin synthase [Bryobacteraceae bacterium]